MSGKDFYEDDTGDASKYYRPDAPAQASFFAGAPAPAPVATPGAPGAQENIFKDHVSAFGAAPPRPGGYGTVPPPPAQGPVMTGSIDPMPAAEPAHDDSSFRDDIDLIREKPPAAEPAPEEAPTPSSYSWWQPEFYRYLFNVDTAEVLNRLRKSLIPWPPNFIDIARQNPDLYGPFWITSTVVFLMAAAGNINSYVNYASKAGDQSPWHYDINYVSFSAFAIYGYNFLIPIILWGACRCLDINLHLMDCICIYGYALFVYIPVTMLAVIPFDWLRWVLVGVAAAISSLFLAGNLFAELKNHVKYGLLLTGIVVLLNLGLALTFKLYFFHLVDASEPSHTTPPPTTAAVNSTHHAI